MSKSEKKNFHKLIIRPSEKYFLTFSHKIDLTDYKNDEKNRKNMKIIIYEFAL